MIHNFWLRKYGIDGLYDRVAVPPGFFLEFAATIGTAGLLGANVTVPHKESALVACDRATNAARAIGAVNTLWRDGPNLCGDNTDVGGFLGSLDEEAPGWRGELGMALVLGAGGAARAVVNGLLSAGAESVIVVNRSAERASTVSEAFGAGVSAASWEELVKWMQVADLFVNTTSLGMLGQPALEIDLAPLRSKAIVMDVVYVPLLTPLLQQARRRGLRAVGGLGMLLHQAAPGFERWFGIRPSISKELRALVESDILDPSRNRS
jgi:shikimate dehydrogenase